MRISSVKPVPWLAVNPVAQMVDHGASNAKIISSIPREKQELIKK